MRLAINFLAVFVILCAAGSQALADAKTAAADLEKLGGKLVRDAGGDVTTIDMSAAEFGDARVPLLLNFPKANRLILWGAGITDQGVKQLAKLQ